MRLITFTNDGYTSIGALLNDQFAIDIPRAASITGESMLARADMLSLIESGESGLKIVQSFLDNPPEEALVVRESLRLLSPLPRPQQIRDYLCFEEHLRNGLNKIIEMEAAKAADPAAALEEIRLSGRFKIPEVFYRQPLYYNASRMGVGGHDDDVVWPSYSTVIDYELELAAVIGKTVKDVPVEQALDAIFGYTVFNDFTARDEQMVAAEGKLGNGKGKDFEGGNVFGPCIVTADEIGDPYDLEMVARVNGEEWSRGNSRSMHWKFEDIIAHASQSETLWPGEIYASGTVGTGCGVELGRFLAIDDVVELEIEKIGVLRNRVVR